jgi:transcriptional regulator with XRE-family HTH domain
MNGPNQTGRYRLGQLIRTLRKSAGETQEQLGALLNHTHAAFSDIELGKTNLTVKDLAAITNHFNVSLVGVIEQAYRGTDPVVVSTDDQIRQILTDLELNLLQAAD